MELMMKRGEIYFANLDPTIGSEIKKTRPVLIVSNDANNRFSSTVTIIPLTSKVGKVYPFEVRLSTADSGLPKDSKAQCHQIRTISKARMMGNSVGQVDKSGMLKIRFALALHLGF
jgi:mRNA interferase MazF